MVRYLPTHVRERIEGLVPQDSKITLLTEAMIIIKTLREDGFDTEDCVKYLNREIMIMAKKMGM